MFKQIKHIIITLMTMIIVDPRQSSKRITLICRQRLGTRSCCRPIVNSEPGFAPGAVGLEGATLDKFLILIIAMKSIVGFPHRAHISRVSCFEAICS